MIGEHGFIGKDRSAQQEPVGSGQRADRGRKEPERDPPSGPSGGARAQSQRHVQEPRGWWQTGHSTTRQRRRFFDTPAVAIRKAAMTATTDAVAGSIVVVNME
jgi:hypothetical protein